MVHLCGYYDQVHFIHEFHEVMKIYPLEFLKRTNRKFYLNCAFYSGRKRIFILAEIYNTSSFSYLTLAEKLVLTACF